MRVASQIDPDEHAAAAALLDLASYTEYLCDNLHGVDTSAPTTQALHKVQRVLKPVVEFYYGDESPLIWTPPDYKFQPKKGIPK